jgi:hypothetical protein
MTVLDYQNLKDDIILKKSSDSLLNRLSEFKIDIIERYQRGDKSCKLNSKYFYKRMELELMGN